MWYTESITAYKGDAMETVKSKNGGLKLNIPRTILVGLAFFTITMFWEVYDNLMPLFLVDFDIGGTLRGLIMALDNVLALVLLPFMGLWSDRFPMKLRNKFGRRIPFIVCGSILAASTFILLNFAHNQRILWLMMLATIFVLLFMCFYRTPAVALMPDVTPKQIRSQGNTVINIMGTVGGVVTLLLMTFLLKKETLLAGTPDEYTVLVGNNWVLVLIIAGLMVLSAVVMMLKVKENKFVEEKMKQLSALGINEDEDEEEKPQQKTSTKAVLSGLTKAQLMSLFMILASVFLWYMAYNGVKSHFSTFAMYTLGDKNFTIPLLIANASAFIMFVPASILGKKIGRKYTIMIGVGLLILGFGFSSVLLLAGVPMSVVRMSMYPAFIFVGAGWATINVHSYVMSVEMATEETTGTYTGMYYTFSMAAQVITPIIAGAIMEFLSARLLMPYALLFSCLAFVTMAFVKHGNARTTGGIDKGTPADEPPVAQLNAEAGQSAAEEIRD